MYILSFTHHFKMSSRLVKQDFTYILSFRNSIGKATAQQLIITFYVRRSLHDIFAFIQSSRNDRIVSELRYMVLKVCVVILIIILTLFLVGYVFAVSLGAFYLSFDQKPEKNPREFDDFAFQQDSCTKPNTILVSLRTSIMLVVSLVIASGVSVGYSTFLASNTSVSSQQK